MLVFLKTSEEATCVPNDTCAWTYTSTIPEVKNISAQWDNATQKYHVIVNGTGWTGDASTTVLYSEGMAQKTLLQDNDNNYTIFEVSNITGQTLSNMKLYFDVGTPKGHDTVIDGNYLVLEPKLVSLSISEGSAGGSLIKARVEGFGVGGHTATMEQLT